MRINANTNKVLTFMFKRVNSEGLHITDKAYWLVLILVLLVGIFLRAQYVDQPLFGLHHHRMNESAAMARNFATEEFNILRPRIDWRGNSPGYLEEAFQPYTFLVASLYKIFGVHDEIGRIVSIVFFTLAALMLFLLARNLFDKTSALFVAFFFIIAPLGIYFGASFQPDSLTLFLGITSIFLFKRWYDTGDLRFLFGSSVALGIAVMMQPMTLHLGLPIAYMAIMKHRLNFYRQWYLWAFVGLVFIPAIVWYWHAHQLYIEYGNTNGVWSTSWKFNTTDYLFSPHFYGKMTKRVFFLISTFVGVPILLFGIFIKPKSKLFLVHIWLLAVMLLVALAPGSHLPHEYYQMPVITVVALFMGSAAAYMWKLNIVNGTLIGGNYAMKMFLISMFILVTSKSLNVVHNRYQMPTTLDVQLGYAAAIKNFSKENELVIVGTHVKHGQKVADERCCRHRDDEGRYFGHGPIVFYQSKRKGWSIHYEDWDISTIKYLKAKGAKYFVTNYEQGIEEKSAFLNQLGNNFTLLDKKPNWVIYKLD